MMPDNHIHHNHSSGISITEMFDLFGGTVPEIVTDFLRENRSPQLSDAFLHEILELLGAAYRQGLCHGRSDASSQLRRLLARLQVLESREEEINTNLFEWQMEAARRGNPEMLIWLDRKMNGDPDCRDDKIEDKLSDLDKRIARLEAGH